MNILYHHRTQGKGVEGIHIRSIVKALRDLNHNVTTISPTGCDPINDETSGPSDNSTPIKTFFVLVSRLCPEFLFEFLELIYNIPAYFRIRKVLKNGKIDMIYERYFLFSIASMLLSRKYHVPIIYEVNDSSFVPRLRKLVFTTIANFFEQKVLSISHSVITVSNKFKKQLVHVGIPEDKIIVCHNAIDPAMFNPSKLPNVDIAIDSDSLIVGFVGLFVKWVGLETLIKVFRKIHADFPNTHLLLVGGGPEEVNLRRLIKDSGLQPHITITGKVSHEMVPAYINKMDICTIPKHEKYTSPVKLFEYMAMGKALLVPAYESIKEVIEHGENGLLFDPGDEIDFVKGITTIIEDHQLRESLGQRARYDVLKSHTWSQNARQIIGQTTKSVLK